MAAFLLSKSIRITTNSCKMNMKWLQMITQIKVQPQHQQLWYSLSSKLANNSLDGKVTLPNINNEVMKISRDGNDDAHNQQQKWQTIYHFQLISVISAYNRLKKPYGLLNAITIPTVFAIEQIAQLPPTYTTLATAVGLTSWLTLAISSLFARNLIGFIYINDETDKMKLAYIDYWGKRHDRILTLDDVKIVPSKLQFYKTVHWHDDKYILLHRHGTFLDHYIFAGILDQIEEQ